MAMHWVVVADGSRARIVEANADLEGMRVLAELTHDKSRARTADLISGPAGATHTMTGGHSAFDRHSDPHDVEEDRFAHEIASHLHRGVEDRAFERLILCAPARFLGMLRAAAKPDVTAKVVGSVHRDWTHAPLHELPKRLREGLPEDAGYPPKS